MLDDPGLIVDDEAFDDDDVTLDPYTDQELNTISMDCEYVKSIQDKYDLHILQPLKLVKTMITYKLR